MERKKLSFISGLDAIKLPMVSDFIEHVNMQHAAAEYRATSVYDTTCVYSQLQYVEQNHYLYIHVDHWHSRIGGNNCHNEARENWSHEEDTVDVDIVRDQSTVTTLLPST